MWSKRLLEKKTFGISTKIYTEVKNSYNVISKRVMCAGAPVRCVRRPSEELHTCHWGDPHHSLQDSHLRKVKTKLHHLLFIKTPPFNAAICQLEKRMLKAFRQKMCTLTEDNTDLCFFTRDDLPLTTSNYHA